MADKITFNFSDDLDYQLIGFLKVKIELKR